MLLCDWNTPDSFDGFWSLYALLLKFVASPHILTIVLTIVNLTLFTAHVSTVFTVTAFVKSFWSEISGKSAIQMLLLLLWFLLSHKWLYPSLYYVRYSWRQNYLVCCAWRYCVQVTDPTWRVRFTAGADRVENWTYIPGGCWLEERKLTSQSPSITVQFSFQLNLKITSVITDAIYIHLHHHHLRKLHHPTFTTNLSYPPTRETVRLLQCIFAHISDTVVLQRGLPLLEVHSKKSNLHYTRDTTPTRAASPQLSALATQLRRTSQRHCVRSDQNGN